MAVVKLCGDMRFGFIVQMMTSGSSEIVWRHAFWIYSADDDKWQ